MASEVAGWLPHPGVRHFEKGLADVEAPKT
jgi:hypothetical protein